MIEELLVFNNIDDELVLCSKCKDTDLYNSLNFVKFEYMAGRNGRKNGCSKGSFNGHKEYICITCHDNVIGNGSGKGNSNNNSNTNGFEEALKCHTCGLAWPSSKLRYCERCLRPKCGYACDHCHKKYNTPSKADGKISCNKCAQKKR